MHYNNKTLKQPLNQFQPNSAKHSYENVEMMGPVVFKWAVNNTKSENALKTLKNTPHNHWASLFPTWQNAILLVKRGRGVHNLFKTNTSLNFLCTTGTLNLG